VAQPQTLGCVHRELIQPGPVHEPDFGRLVADRKLSTDDVRDVADVDCRRTSPSL
jgi:hypothetical protein